MSDPSTELAELALIDTFLQAHVLPSPPDWKQQISLLYHTLVEINQRVNLTRITSAEDFIVKHVIDSLLALLALPELGETECDVLDLGCGGGFPGLPLAIFCPFLRLTEMDGTGKKVTAVREFAKRLELSNVEAVHSRGAEWAAHTGKKYDVILARAVKDGAYLIRECQRLLRPGGVLLAFKTPATIDREYQAARREARRLKFGIELSDEYELPGQAGVRQFMLIGNRK